MKERHVILRAVGPSGASRGGMLSGPTAGPRDTGSGKVSVEIEDIDTGAAKSLRKKQEILAVAPVMPMKLIAPRASKAQAATTVDWGVTAVGAVTSPFSGDGITVAVLDTGIDPTHDAFKDVTLVRKNFTDDASDDDTHGHGTHCAGTIFGRDVESTRIGVARGVKKALIGKVIGEDGGPTDRLVMAINWAVDEGANVISMSLGMDFPGFQLQLQQQLGLPPELATSRALEGYRQNVLLFESLAAVVRTRAAVKQPTIIIAAAGNESRTDENPDFKIAVSPPAVSEGIISVAALGLSGTKFVVAPFSNTGALVSGPGVDITSAKPGGGLTVMSGTSMATPHVAGVAALWAQKLQMIGPLKTPLFVTRLTDSGTLANLEAGFDPGDVGSGMVQAPQS